MTFDRLTQCFSRPFFLFFPAEYYLVATSLGEGKKKKERAVYVFVNGPGVSESV